MIPLPQIVETVVPRLVWTLVHSVWEGVAVAAVLAAALRVVRMAALEERRPPRVSLAALAVACVALPLAAVAQQQPEAAPAAARSASGANPPPATEAGAPPAMAAGPILPEDLKAVRQDYRISPSDLLRIGIYELDGPNVEMVKNARVGDESGKISLPFVGEVKVAGLTTGEAERAIAKAYGDAALIRNAQVSVTVAEARGRLVSILGQVDRPGEYAIPQSDFRLTGALALAGGRPDSIGTLSVMRAADGANQRRVIEIPVAKLIAGDASVDVVIRPGDLVVVKGTERRSARVVVGRDSLTFEGKPADWTEIEKAIGQMPEGQRKATVLEVAAAAPDVTVERYFGAFGRLSDLAKRYGLASLSQTGFQPATAPAAAAAPAPADGETGVYYLSGPVTSAGKYALPEHRLTLMQAMIANKLDPPDDWFVSVLRHEKDKSFYVLQNIHFSDLISGKQRDLYLHADDVIRVDDKSLPPNVPATQDAPLP